jgi:hypothetical protein
VPVEFDGKEFFPEYQLVEHGRFGVKGSLRRRVSTPLVVLVRLAGASAEH